MTCPYAPSVVGAGTADIHPDLSPDVIGYIRFSKTLLPQLFASAVFDQAMVPGICAALRETGRVRQDPVGRAARTRASEQLMSVVKDPDVAVRESERLLRLHREVRGVSPEGIRYSALSPELWNWVLYSAFFAYYRAYRAVAPTNVEADPQGVWDQYKRETSGLHLPGRSRPIERYDDLVAYYDEMAREHLQVTPTLHDAVSHVHGLARPEVLPPVFGPLWVALNRLLLDAPRILGFGIMHPDARRLLPYKWTRARQARFVAYTGALRLLYRILPDAMVLNPLARAEGKRATRLIEKYQAMGLSSFAPDHVGPRDQVLSA